jgi:aminopeptidase N
MNFKKLKLLWCGIFVLVVSIVSGVAVEEYHLPKTVIPTNYDIIIKMRPNVFESGYFEGEVNITLNIINTTREIKIHAKNLTDLIFDLVVLDGNRTSLNNTVRDPVTDILTITSPEEISAGKYFLKGSYNGTFSPYDMHGLYKSSFKNNTGGMQYLAATQLQSTHARKVFPCFDEPDFKATFKLSVVFPKNYSVMANTMIANSTINEDLERVDFGSTPVMSTYLNAFIVSTFTCDEINGSVPCRVCSRPESQNERKYALQITPKLLEFMETFTGIPYNASGINKLDLVAIPDFSAGAMENWGLITFRETALLWNADYSSNEYKQRVASVVAHEIAHMWFGNLVTFRSWSDPFLNEGFARYFQYFATAQVETEWELEEQFVVEQVQQALAVDVEMNSSFANANATHALSSAATTPEEISARFDTITYNKGASVIRMFAHAVGLDNFQKGLREYLEQHKFNNTVPEDLWSLFKNVAGLDLDLNLENAAKNWTYQAGYPVVHVTTNGTDVVITQEVFVSDGNTSTKWYVPITYATSNGDNFTNTTTKLWLTPNHKELKLPIKINQSDWIILNNRQIGYYRVKYDDNLLKRIRQVLDEPSSVDVIARAQIVDDLFNFALAGKVPFSKLLDFVKFLENDTAYYSWYAAFNGFSTILNKVHKTDIRTDLMNYIKNLMAKLHNSVPVVTEDVTNHIYTLKQTMVHKWACKLGDSECVENSKKMFSAYKSGVSPRKNFKLTTYCYALRHSNRSEEDWNFLWEKYKRENIATEQATILSALGCTTNSTLLKKYLNLAIDSSEIRRQDFFMVLSSITRDNPTGVNVTLQFLIDDYDKIYNFAKNDQDTIMVIQSLAATFTEEQQANKLSDLTKNKQVTERVSKSVELSVKLAKVNLEKTALLEKGLGEYFNGKRSSATKQIENFHVVATALIVILIQNLVRGV